MSHSLAVTITNTSALDISPSSLGFFSIAAGESIDISSFFLPHEIRENTELVSLLESGVISVSGDNGVLPIDDAKFLLSNAGLDIDHEHISVGSIGLNGQAIGSGDGQVNISNVDSFTYGGVKTLYISFSNYQQDGDVTLSFPAFDHRVLCAYAIRNQHHSESIACTWSGTDTVIINRTDALTGNTPITLKIEGF